MNEMTWEQKLWALKALCDTCLRMREPGDWYVSATGREYSKDNMLTGEYGNGPAPQEAVENDWNIMLKNMKEGHPIVLHASGRDRREVQWNGFMWVDRPHVESRPT